MSQTQAVVRPSEVVVRTGHHLAEYLSSGPYVVGPDGRVLLLGDLAADECKNGRLLVNPFRQRITERLVRMRGQYASPSGDRLPEDQERLIEFEYERRRLAGEPEVQPF